MRQLVLLLQNAHAGELAAFYAYNGHAKSVRCENERSEIEKIKQEEWVHRECVAGLLRQLGAGPRPGRELLMKYVGLTIGFLCRIGGWFIPMYGAGRLEAGNIQEYITAAELARDLGYPDMIEPLLNMAEIEWDHEYYFRQKVLSHWMHRWLPSWVLPAPRVSLRLKFIDVGSDYYFDDLGQMVFTRAYHLKRGHCCGSGCRNCPFEWVNVEG